MRFHKVTIFLINYKDVTRCLEENVIGIWSNYLYLLF